MKEERDKQNQILIEPGECPDYWETIDKNTCRNIHRIGKCGLDQDVAFTDDMFNHPRTGQLMKCKWSKQCESPWEHISDTC